MKLKIAVVVIVFFIGAVNAAQADLLPCKGLDCTLCHLGALAKNIIDFIMILVFPITALMIVYGGVMMMISAGSESKFASGKKIATSAVFGLVIALLAWMIIDTIIKIIAGGNVGPWNEISC